MASLYGRFVECVWGNEWRLLSGFDLDWNMSESAVKKGDEGMVSGVFRDLSDFCGLSDFEMGLVGLSEKERV